MKKIKQIIWDLAGETAQKKYMYAKLRKSDDYRRLLHAVDHQESVCPARRVFLLDTPGHVNLGDHAIVIAMRKFMQAYFPEDEIYEFTFDECTYCMEKIAGKIRQNDLLLIPGGGFIGTLWQREQENVLHILETCAEFQIIIFPQTLYFDMSANGEKELERFCAALKKCKNVSLFVRDKKSFGFAKEKGIDQMAEITLVPDIVTWLPCKLKKQGRRQKKVLFCLRDDLEKQADTKVLESIKRELVVRGYEVLETSTVSGRNISKQEREQSVREKLEEFSQAELVITDRLHGMIFSAITSTPCIAMDNLSRKVSGGYEWLKYLEYIQMVEPETISMDSVKKMLDYNGKGYSRQPLEQYYGKIKHSIRLEEA